MSDKVVENGGAICAMSELEEGGRGVRFRVEHFGGRQPAFVILYKGEPYAYLNRCGHVPAQLDWNAGEFFDSAGLYLLCATHGAVYEPRTGSCAGGPCNGRGLIPLSIEERDGTLYYLDQDNDHV